MEAALRSARAALKGLNSTQKQQLQQGMRLLESGRKAQAGLLLSDLARSAPDRAEVLRACGLCHMANGEWQQAVDCLARAHALRPRDMQLLLQLARAQDQAHDHAGLQNSLRAAAELAESANDWFVLSLEHDRAGGSSNPANSAQWNLNSSNNLFGFRFLNELTSQVHYGWARIAFGSVITNRTLVEYAYESDAGIGINAGNIRNVGAVPEPGTLALLGLGLTGLALTRKRQKAA